MGRFDFTSIIDRRGRDAIAVEIPESADFMAQHGARMEGMDTIPMWVADMNFATAPAVTDAMRARIDHPLFGYFSPRDEYYAAIQSWQRRRNGVTDLPREAIGYENGVLGGVLSAVRATAAPGDKILLHSPTYIGFTGSLENAGYRIVLSPLYRDDQGIWRMDYEDMERKIRENKIHTVIFCSPHNPCGRVWEREEIRRAMEVYADCDCTVISDEIWSDLILPGHTHIPTQQVSEEAKRRTVALYAPTKTFSLAGLVGSYHVIYDERLREQVEKEAALSHYNSMNVLSMAALIGAYSEDGEAWLDELIPVLAGNLDRMCTYLTNEVEGLSLAQPQGSYMLFVDCSEYCKKAGITLDTLLNRGFACGVIWQDGRPFHGECSIRMNLALPASRVEEAIRRLRTYAFI